MPKTPVNERYLVSQIDFVLSNKDIGLTTPSSVHEQIETVNGPVPYLEWCQREAKRINRNPERHAYVKEFRDSRGRAYCCVIGNYYLGRFDGKTKPGPYRDTEI